MSEEVVSMHVGQISAKGAITATPGTPLVEVARGLLSSDNLLAKVSCELTDLAQLVSWQVR